MQNIKYIIFIISAKTDNGELWYVLYKKENLKFIKKKIFATLLISRHTFQTYPV